MNNIRIYVALAVIITTVSISPHLRADDEKLKTSGFATIALSQSDGEYPYVQGVTKDYSFRPFSLAGVQFDYTVNEDTAFVAQATAIGVDNWETQFEWAFFRYKLMPNVSVRAGRMRAPGFMFSDYVKIGYAYPWISPPSEVYGGADTPMDGLDLIYKGSLSDNWSFSARPYFGTIDVNDGATTNDLIGMDLNASSDVLSVSLGYRSAKSTFADDYVLEAAIDQVYAGLAQAGFDAVRPGDSRFKDQRVQFYSAGFVYDDGSLLLMGEYTGYSWTGETYLPDVTGSYLTAGWHFGKVMPHLTFSKTRSDEDTIYDFPSFPISADAAIDPVNDFLMTSLNTDQETWTIGVRWDFKPNVAFKAEYQRIGGFNGTSGLFTVPYAVPPAQQVVLDEDDPDINLFRIALTGTF